MTTRISNSARNGNRSARVGLRVERDKGGTNVQGTGISFTAGATIADSGNGLGVFPVGSRIEVRGSAANNRQFQVTASAAGSLTVLPAVVSTASAGPAVTIRRVGN